MHVILGAALIGLSLAGAAIVGGQPALAADNITVGISNGGIAFGYSDGYWDRDHKWHNWANNDAADRFRSENKDHYYDRRHDADADQGWRDKDRYWDQR
jgi:hypothetical protein